MTVNKNTIIFLGAGASAAEGAPIQNNLFKDYFKPLQNNQSYNEMDRNLITFFYYMFGIDLEHADLEKINFPTFEEVLSIVDFAILRKESFKDFDLENRSSNSGRLRFIRQYLSFLLAKVLHDKLRIYKGLHKCLIVNLNSQKILNNTSFITTNYDILIDNAILSNGYNIDYGIDFTNLNRKNLSNYRYLFKIHGSLNWLYCPTCNNLTLTPNEKGVMRLFNQIDKSFCDYCQTEYQPLIIPPTFYKDFSNTFLNTIFNKSENILRKAQHIIFSGYSFPDADMHIKYLLKRIQTNRKNSLKITVINNHPNKSNDLANEEKNRFKRFFGAGVDYTDKTFDDLVNNPSAFY